MKTRFESWGRVHGFDLDSRPLSWRSDPFPDIPQEITCLPFGLGRSYGDSCLNEGGCMIPATGLNRFLRFDEEEGIIRCKAGVSLEEILRIIVPRGWFLPTTPGTKFVTVGGAIANDIHGKNHHNAGTFGCHVTQFELLRSDNRRLLCSPTENSDYFKATIGGLGLTGLITWAEFRLKKIESAYLNVETVRFNNLDRFFALSEEDSAFEYAVAWVDCMARGRDLGRGFYYRGNHALLGGRQSMILHSSKGFHVPCDMPGWLLNRFTARFFNALYYRKESRKSFFRMVHYDPFFYPLDRLLSWNRLYGKRGFFQYQYVIPDTPDHAVSAEILEFLSKSGLALLLGVLKKFGSVASPGLLSFPREGVTLALDIPNYGAKSEDLFRKLDAIVSRHGGRVYPAKDGRMRVEDFRQFYPRWEEFEEFIDPKFESSFWRRVRGSDLNTATN